MVYPSTSGVLSRNGILLVFLSHDATQSAVLLWQVVRLSVMVVYHDRIVLNVFENNYAKN